DASGPPLAEPEDDEFSRLLVLPDGGNFELGDAHLTRLFLLFPVVRHCESELSGFYLPGLYGGLRLLHAGIRAENYGLSRKENDDQGDRWNTLHGNLAGVR